MIFRKSVIKDVDQMTEIANQSKLILKSRGVNQWQRGTYPDKAVFTNDVAAGIGYVIAEDEEIVAICALTLTDEKCYRQITGGKWLTRDDDTYVTVHRSAVAQKHQRRHISGRLFREAEKFGKANGALSVRVDTHPDNLVMQGALEKAGFTKCGEFYLTDGDEAGDLRFGYEKLLSWNVNV